MDEPVKDRESIAKMLGAFLRESAVLTAVFIPIDRIIGQRAEYSWTWLAGTVLTSALLLASGIIIERTRRD
jgi:hypothetical protein